MGSFPDEVKLCISGIPGAGYGVCAKQHIPVGTWIGPYEGKHVSIDDVTSDMDTSYMWEVWSLTSSISSCTERLHVVIVSGVPFPRTAGLRLLSANQIVALAF